MKDKIFGCCAIAAASYVLYSIMVAIQCDHIHVWNDEAIDSCLSVLHPHIALTVGALAVAILCLIATDWTDPYDDDEETDEPEE